MLNKEEIEINHTKDSFCVRIPLITEQELKKIDDNLNSITDELTKQVIHDKDLAIAQHVIQKQKERIDQLEFEVQAKEKVHRYDVKMIDEVKGEAVKLYKEIDKLNKIINETVKYIATLDIDEDICSKTQNKHCDKMSFGECENCIKQYFEEKVMESNVKNKR